jgi:hypothetical protein
VGVDRAAGGLHGDCQLLTERLVRRYDNDPSREHPETAYREP